MRDAARLDVITNLVPDWKGGFEMPVLPKFIAKGSGRQWEDGQRMRDWYGLPEGQASSICIALIIREQKMIGTWNLLNMLEGIEAFSMALFTRFLGYTAEEVQVLISDVRKDLRDPKIHSQLDL